MGGCVAINDLEGPVVFFFFPMGSNCVMGFVVEEWEVWELCWNEVVGFVFRVGILVNAQGGSACGSLYLGNGKKIGPEQCLPWVLGWDWPVL